MGGGASRYALHQDVVNLQEENQQLRAEMEKLKGNLAAPPNNGAQDARGAHLAEEYRNLKLEVEALKTKFAALPSKGSPVANEASLKEEYNKLRMEVEALKQNVAAPPDNSLPEACGANLNEENEKLKVEIEALKSKLDAPLDISVRDASGAVIAQVSAGVDITTKEVARRVAAQAGISAARVILMHDGAIMEAHLTLQQVGLRPSNEGTELMMVLREDATTASIGQHPQEAEHLAKHGYGDAKGWKLLTRHMYQHGMFSAGEYSRNQDPEAPLFTDLQIDYDQYRTSGGELVFKVVWPQIATTFILHRGHGPGGNLDHEYMLWAQTSAPLQNPVRGLKPIFLPYPGDGAKGHPFGGAGGGGGGALLHGNTNGYWWYCFASHGCGGFRGIPGPCMPNGSYIEVQHVELWIAQF